MAESAFKVVSTVIADGGIPISKFRSNKTGLSVCIADIKGPLVHGYFCVATEAFDNDGLPHILEHLTFLGSEDFPYKGVLDLLAGRSLASGTNAWTSTDHTYYTVTTAGSQGFLNILPIFCDHILYPCLTEFGYITEVHHITGEGEDAGVVYCEVQANENLGENRTQTEFMRAMYPGRCGYNSVTGGLMKNLRESATHEKVCSYHKEFYRPDNICLIIIGQIRVKDVFEVLQPLEQKILSKGRLPSISRPWQTPVPQLPESVEKLVRYAADDETHGIVSVGWRGPRTKDQYAVHSVKVMLEYLTNTAISPVQRTFVNTSQPYCSDVQGKVDEYSESCIYLKFDNVLKSKLNDVFPRLQEVIRDIANGSEKIDMSRLSHIIQRRILDALSVIESQPQKQLASLLIRDFLYGDTPIDLEDTVQSIKLITQLKMEPEKYWVDLINRYLIDTYYVLVLGIPSKLEKEHIAKKEKERIEKQRADLGRDGLKQREDELEKALKENDRKAPGTMLTSVDVPNTENIHFHSIIRSCNRTLDKIQNEAQRPNPPFPLDNIPFRFQLDDLASDFVQIHVLMDSSKLPQNLKYFLPLYCELIFGSPVLRDEVLISHEEVITQLNADTLSTDSCLGINGRRFFCGSFPQIVCIKLQVEMKNYETGVKLLHDILFHTKFSAERVKVVARRIRNDVSKCRRSGINIVHTLMRNILFSGECNHQINSMFTQSTFLDCLIKQLNTEPHQVEENLQEVSKLITDQDNLTVHLSADVKKLTAYGYSLVDVWSTFVPEREKNQELSGTLKMTHDYVVPLSECKERSVIAGLGSLETSFLLQVVDCMQSFIHQDLATIMVYIQYLIQMEGPMWKQIRGRGLCYNIRMYLEPESGLLYFLLARSSDIVCAYKEGRDIAMKYIKGKMEMSETELESAKGSLIFKMVEKISTISEATTHSLLAYLMDVPSTYNSDMVRLISKVTLEDMRQVGAKYIAALFDEDKVRRVVCCSSYKVLEIIQSFRKIGILLKEVSPG